MRFTRQGLTLLAVLACIGVAVAQDQQAAPGCAVTQRTDSPVPEAAPQYSQLGRETIKVPIEFVMGLPTIEAKINGQGPFRFIFDTGAGTVVLDESLAKELDIEPTGTTRIGDPAAPEAVEATTYTVDHISIGEAQFSEVNAVSWSGGMMRQVRGIIGLPLLYEAIVSINYPNEQLTLWRGALGPNDGSIPYRLDQGWIITIDVDVAGEKIVGHIDSGNMGGIMLPLSMAERLPLKSPPRIVGRARTISSSFDIHTASLDGTLSFAGQTFENPQLNFNDHLLNAANLGRTALEPFVLTIDQINRRLRFDRPDTDQVPQRRAEAPGPQRPKYGMMFNGLGAGPMTVSGTQPDSIAERAGLQAGDVIIRLNGKDADNLSQNELATLFRSSPVKLVMQRDGKETQIEMRLPEKPPSVLRSRPARSAKDSGPAIGPGCGVPVCGVPLSPEEVDTSVEPSITASAQLVSIDDSLQPVIDQFNADKDKPRIVALLSPTCRGCIYGAEAILQEALRAYPDDELSVLVVWEPMLGSDNEAAARESAKLFDDPRVHQFWDPQRRSGITYSTKLFPNRMREIAAAMPADHFLNGRFQKAAAVPPERIPMWDFALFYPPGVEWTGDTPPWSANWIRQLAVTMTSDGITSAALLVDNFTQPPIESDWFDEVQREMQTLMATRQESRPTRNQ